MCRFLIISINDGRSFEDFDWFSNTSKLTDMMTTLKTFYEEAHETALEIIREFCNENSTLEEIKNILYQNMGYIPYNEPEFVAYNLLMIHNKTYEFYRDITVLNHEELEYVLNSK